MSLTLFEGGTERDRASTLPSSDPDHACHSPRKNRAVFPNEGSCNTGGRNHCADILILKYSGIRFSRLERSLLRVFDTPDQHRLRVGNQIAQDNWTKRGLYVSYTWLESPPGFVDALVVITMREGVERWERVLTLLPRSPSDIIQGVSS